MNSAIPLYNGIVQNSSNYLPSFRKKIKNPSKDLS